MMLTLLPDRLAFCSINPVNCKQILIVKNKWMCFLF